MVLRTAQVVKLEGCLLRRLKNKTVMIFGGYYNDNMQEIVDVASLVTVFLSQGDKFPAVTPESVIHCVFATENRGSLLWTADKLDIDGTFTRKMIKYLDSYAYGNPCKHALKFQNGIYTLEGETDLERLLSIKTWEEIDEVIARGSEKRNANKRVAEQRLQSAMNMIITVPTGRYSFKVSFGDTPILDTTMLLAKHSIGGLGMLIRYNYHGNRTLITVRRNELSNIDVGKLMAEWIGGGGSPIYGGGSLEGILSPHQIAEATCSHIIQ